MMGNLKNKFTATLTTGITNTTQTPGQNTNFKSNGTLLNEFP